MISSVSNEIPTMYYSLDTRRMISSQLQLIASHCHWSQITITNTLNVLLSNRLFIPKMISQDSMNSQIDAMVDETIRDAITKQDLNRRMTTDVALKQSLLFSALSNNFLYANIDNTHQGYYFAKWVYLKTKNNSELFSYYRYLRNWTYPPHLGYDK